MKISRSTLNACFIICSSILHDSFSPSTTRYHKQTDLESKHQTRHVKFTPFGLRYKLRARHTESVKVFLETSDTKHHFEQQVYNVHDSLKISEFQFSSFMVRLDRFTVLPLPIPRHGIPISTEADWVFYRAHCPRVLRLSKYKSAKSTSGAVNQILGNCDCNQLKHVISDTVITLNSTKELKNG